MEKMVNVQFGNIYKGKRILVTGHTGFKGSWLTLWLKSLGAEICGYSIKPNTNPSHWDLLNLDIRSHYADIRDAKELNKVVEEFAPEIVFHLAAQPLVRLSYSNPVETYSTNIMGTLNVLEACRKIEGVKAIIVVTSDKCYENKEWAWGYREIDPMGGYDPYSSSKGCAELLTASYRSSYYNPSDYRIKHNTLLATVRAGNVIGGGDWADDRLIPDAMKATAENRSVHIRNPYAIRPWQHVLEPLSGYLLLGQRLLEENIDFASAWNLGPDASGTLNVGEVIKKTKEIWDKVNFEFDKDEHPHEAGLLKLDCSKALQYLEWKEVLGVEKTIDYTVQWYKDFYMNGIVETERQLQEYVKLAKQKQLIWTN